MVGSRFSLQERSYLGIYDSTTDKMTAQEPKVNEAKDCMILRNVTTEELCRLEYSVGIKIKNFIRAGYV